MSTVPTLVACMRSVDMQCARLQAAQGEVWCLGVGERLQERFTYDTATGYPMFISSKGAAPPCLGDINVSVKEVIDLYGDVKDESMCAKMDRVSATPAWRRLVANSTSLASALHDVNEALAALLGAMGHNVVAKSQPKKRRRTVVKKPLTSTDMDAYADELEKSMDPIIMDSDADV